MSLLKKLLVWLVGIVVFLALCGLVFVWVVLGVNPFEGRQEQLWELTSHDVDFFIRFPGSRVLRDPLAERLSEERGFEPLSELRYRIEDLTAEIARKTAGQLPFGQDVNFERDFVGREMAVAGSIRGDYHQLKLDNFLVLTRIAPYAKFLSALKRGFVRDRIPEADGRIELVKGLYFRVRVDPDVREALDKFRSLKGGRGERDSLYVARIRDVLLISDNDQWIEDALWSSKQVLPADAWFESEFIRSAHGGDSVEAFFRLALTSHALQAHSRVPGSLVYTLEKILPIEMAGDVTVRAKSIGAGELSVSFSDLPGKGAFGKIAPALQKLYDEKKADIRTELGPEGVGKFIPKEDVVGALVLRADANALVDMIQQLLPADALNVFDDEVRRSSNGRWPDFDRLLRHLTEDLGDTHLLIFHRPRIFRNIDPMRYEAPPGEEPLPRGQMALSIVSRVKDSVSPAAVEQRITENLQYLGLKSMGVDKTYNFRKASPIELSGTEELELFDPAYGPIGNRFVFLSSMWGAAEALHRAAGDENERLVNDPGISAVVRRLPQEGTLGLVLDGPTLAASLFDGVREWTRDQMGIPIRRAQRAEELRKEGKSEDDISEVLNREMPGWKQDEHQRLVEKFRDRLRPLDVVDAAGLVASLGVGSEKRVKAELRLLLAGAASGNGGGDGE